MNKIKKLQKKLDKANKGTGNTTEATDSREEIVDVLGKKGGRLYDKINRSKKSSYQGIAPVKGMSDEQARNIDEDYPSPINHCSSDMMHSQSWNQMRKRNKSALNMLGVTTPLNQKVSWKYGKGTYSGDLIPSMETSTHRYARTHNGKIKSLPKNK